jgi:4-amino-4-deoxychorismate lyase
VTDRWFVDGVEGGAVPADDRGLAYGDGLFETIAVRSGQPRFLDYHVRRLDEGAERLGLPIDMSTISREIAGVASFIGSGTIRLTVTRGSGPRGYAPPQPAVPRRILAARPEPLASPSGVDWPIDVTICSTRAARSPATAGLKTLGALERVLASREIGQSAVGEGLMLDPDGLLVGGTRTNVFMVRGGSLVTPDLRESGVRGVMRAIVMEVARGLDIRVAESPCTPGMLRAATEVFVSNALMGIRPVRRLDDKLLATGPVTLHIARALRGRGVMECPA